MRKILLVASAIAIILVLALLLTQSSAETIPYSIKGTTGEIEFRQYPSLVLAMTDNSQNDAGFNLLFAYISGSNKARDKIPMTAPVITSQKIPMTSPVVSNATSMSFVLPAGKTREETPDPLDRPGADRHASGTGGHCYPLHGICLPTRGGCSNITFAGRAKKGRN